MRKATTGWASNDDGLGHTLGSTLGIENIAVGWLQTKSVDGMAAAHHRDESVWERLERGRKAKAARGGYVGYGSPAYGQRVINGELVEDPEECQVIELIRRHHKSGKSLQKIADWLNEQGYSTKRGQPWRRISVKRVLDRLYGKPSRFSASSQDLTSQIPTDLTPPPLRSEGSLSRDAVEQP